MRKKELKTKNSWVSKNKKFKKIIYKILYVFCIILILYNVLYIINNTINKQKYINLGNTLYITTEKEDSMKRKKNDTNEQTFVNKNDLVFVWKCKANEIQINDIIGYDINSEITFHRVVNIEEDNDITYYETKADNYMYNDIEKKTLNQVNGKILFRIPLIGVVFRLFENKIMTIFIIIVLLLKFSFNNYRNEINRYRNERHKEIKRKDM